VLAAVVEDLQLQRRLAQFLREVEVLERDLAAAAAAAGTERARLLRTPAERRELDLLAVLGVFGFVFDAVLQASSCSWQCRVRG
jgi:hypothetical protein